MLTVDMHSGSGLRRWAMQCFAAARDPHASGSERERLLTMQKALLELADAQDWLDGKQPPAMCEQAGFLHPPLGKTGEAVTALSRSR
jgi:hypothetical protein